MNRILYLILGLLYSNLTLGQTILTGRIIEVNSNKKGLAGVQVISPFSKDTVRTNETGTFKITCNTEIDKALRSLQVKKPGYNVDNEGIFFQYERESNIEIYMYDFSARKKWGNTLKHDLKLVVYENVKDSLKYSADKELLGRVNFAINTLGDISSLFSHLNFDLYGPQVETGIDLLRKGDLEALMDLNKSWEATGYTEKQVKYLFSCFIDLQFFKETDAFSKSEDFPLVQYGALLGRETFKMPVFKPSKSYFKKVSSYDHFQERLHSIVKMRPSSLYKKENEKVVNELFDWIANLQNANQHLLLDEYALYTLIPLHDGFSTAFKKRRYEHLSTYTAPRLYSEFPHVAIYNRACLENNKWNYEPLYKMDTCYFKFYAQNEQEFGLDLVRLERLSEDYWYLRTPKSRKRLNEFIIDYQERYPYLMNGMIIKACWNVLYDAINYNDGRKAFDQYLNTYKKLIEHANTTVRQDLWQYRLDLLLHQGRLSYEENDLSLAKQYYLNFEKELIQHESLNPEPKYLTILNHKCLDTYFKFALLNFKSKSDIDRHVEVCGFLPKSYFTNGNNGYRFAPSRLDHMKEHFLAIVNLQKKLGAVRDVKGKGDIHEIMIPHWDHLAKAYTFPKLRTSKLDNLFELGRCQLFYDPISASETLETLYDIVYDGVSGEGRLYLLDRIDFHQAVAAELSGKLGKAKKKAKRVKERFSEGQNTRKLVLEDLQYLLKMGLGKETIPEIMNLLI